ncbi:MAG: NAD(P)H-dependent glycerol-3-phosphate dehydrogenase [Aestuariivirga sp.]
MKITIIGAGAWGEALGYVAAKAGHDVSFWSRSKPVLPSHTDAFVAAVPAQHMREALGNITIGSSKLISAAKGIERHTGKLMAEVCHEVAPQSEFYALSGPSFAADVIVGLPTAVALAGPSLASAMHMAEALSTKHFRIYPTDDVTGVEIGGAMKNVLAIACGIVDGAGLGESARASLVTRGFAELSRYAKARGAKAETLMGLSGFGDLMLTCSSTKSRNYSYGLAIGQGLSLVEALAQSRGVVEGAYTAGIASELAHAQNIDMPIVTAVANVVAGHSSPHDEIVKLLARPLRAENE